MPDDRRLTIASTSRLTPEDVARHTFATSRRGFEPGEVRAFLEAVARELHAAAARERELVEEVAAAEHRAAHPVLDEGTLTAALGQETARVLRSAHDAAAELMARAESDGGRLRSQAQEESGRLRSQAQEESEQMQARAEQLAVERAAQADAAAAEIRRRTQQEVGTRIESAKMEAEALVSQARAECRAMVQEAQELRARVLSDLTRRRRVLHSQIEQLRAGRERLAETIGSVRHAVDKVTDDLFRAEDEARLAAEAAGRQLAAQGDGDDLLGAAAPVEMATTAPEEAADALSAGEPVSEAEAEGSGEDERRQQAVEDLFARLRAEQQPIDEGVTVLGPRPGPEPTSARLNPEAHDQPEVVGDPVGPSGALEAPPERAAEPVDDRDPVLVRRDEVLGPVAAALARRLKRAMQDDQNDVLDRLRAQGAWGPAVLPAEEEHEQRYAAAALTHLEEAAKAGAVFGGGKPDDAPGVTELSTELARSVVTPLRRRLQGEGAAVQPGDEAALVEHVGSAYREWKGPRLERTANDHAHGAFAQSVLAVTPPGTTLRWVVDDDGVECPDCDDNALAGPLIGGESFPTGHVHPPAHPGCRCLLVPGTA